MHELLVFCFSGAEGRRQSQSIQKALPAYVVTFTHGEGKSIPPKQQASSAEKMPTVSQISGLLLENI